MISNNELITNKIDNYSNIKASVEKVKDEKMKQDAITALNRFSDEKLQKINDCSETLDVILKNMEFYNSATNDSRGRNSIFNSIERFFFGNYSEFAGINLEIVGFIVKLNTSIPSAFYPIDYNEIRNKDINLILKNTGFAKFLLYERFICNFFGRINSKTNRTYDEIVNTCIENQDLLLINYLIDGHILETAYCLDRKSMIDKLYEIQKEGDTKWTKEKLDLMLLNSKIIQQLLYNSIDSSNKEDYDQFGYYKYYRVVRKLKNNTYEKIKNLLESAQESIKQKIDLEVLFIRYPDPDKSEKIYYSTEIDTLKMSCIAKLMENNYALLSIDNVNAFHKILMDRTIEAQKQREAKLANPQATPAISNQQYTTQ
ncbi:hypothetical protein [Candidatus Mesenet endosymbiont of Phosphuga atrata]|uniref:hypothetical protein n=1 Tax=Candidatus Mesenet endosymbiont of Phosphuga atrata TaxID=3066221 RepID=UPI0030D60E6A